jgi:hypothetical protein
LCGCCACRRRDMQLNWAGTWPVARTRLLAAATYQLLL